MKRIFVLLLAAALLLSLTACAGGGKSSLLERLEQERNNRSSSVSGAPSSEPEPSSEAEPSVSREDVVTDAIAEEKETQFGSLSYHVPQVNLPGAETVNAEIQEDFGQLATEGLESTDEYLPPCYRIDWTLHWYGDTFALVICKHLDGDYDCYKVYSFDYPNGQPLEFEELLSRAGLDANGYFAQVTLRAEQIYREAWGSVEEVDPNSFARQLNWTISDENVRSATHRNIYFDEDGRLMVIMAIGALAGSGSYEMTFPLYEN